MLNQNVWFSHHWDAISLYEMINFTHTGHPQKQQHFIHKGRLSATKQETATEWARTLRLWRLNRSAVEFEPSPPLKRPLPNPGQVRVTGSIGSNEMKKKKSREQSGECPVVAGTVFLTQPVCA